MSSVIFLRLRRHEKGSWTKWRDPDRQEPSGPADELDASPGTSPRHTSSGSGAVDIAMAATVCGAAVGDPGGDSAEEWQFTHGSDGRTEQMAGCPHRRAIWMRRQPTRQLTRHCPAVDIRPTTRQQGAKLLGLPTPRGGERRCRNGVSCSPLSRSWRRRRWVAPRPGPLRPGSRDSARFAPGRHASGTSLVQSLSFKHCLYRQRPRCWQPATRQSTLR